MTNPSAAEITKLNLFIETNTNSIIAWLNQVIPDCLNDPPAVKGGVAGQTEGVAKSYPSRILSMPLNKCGSDMINPPKYTIIYIVK